MTESEKIAVIQEHIKALREEAQSNVESKRKLFQWVVIGVAGAVALRKDVDISDLHAFLPFVPILAMIIVALWLTETGFSFRCGRWLSLAEKRINDLAAIDLVSYEQELLLWRRRAFTRYRKACIVGCFVISTGYICFVVYLMGLSEIRHYSGFAVVVYTLAGGSNLVALIQLFRVYYELRPVTEDRGTRI